MTALIFDTETHKLHGDIIEAAAIEIEFTPFCNAMPIMPTQFDYSKRFKPSEPISLGAMAVHHILDEDLNKCPSFTTFKMPIVDVQYLIGHNIDYDIKAVNRAGVATEGIKKIWLYGIRCVNLLHRAWLNFLTLCGIQFPFKQFIKTRATVTNS